MISPLALVPIAQYVFMAIDDALGPQVPQFWVQPPYLSDQAKVLPSG
jgi:hypothetical protein